MLLPGVGISGAGITPGTNSAKAVISHKTTLNAGTYNIVVKCLPTFAMEEERQMNYSISLNGDKLQTVNTSSEADSPVWKANVLRGYSQGETIHILKTTGAASVTIELKNKNLVISQVEIYKTQ